MVWLSCHFRLVRHPGQSNQSCLPASHLQLLSFQQFWPKQGPEWRAPAISSGLHSLPACVPPSHASFSSLRDRKARWWGHEIDKERPNSSSWTRALVVPPAVRGPGIQAGIQMLSTQNAPVEPSGAPPGTSALHLPLTWVTCSDRLPPPHLSSASRGVHLQPHSAALPCPVSLKDMGPIGNDSILFPSKTSVWPQEYI